MLTIAGDMLPLKLRHCHWLLAEDIAIGLDSDAIIS